MDDRTIAVFNSHVHSQGADSDGDSQANTNPPSTSLGAGQTTINVEGS
jgi:hypothetical protein